MRSSQFLSALLGVSVLLASLPASAMQAGAPAASAPAAASVAEEDAEAKQLFGARKYPEAAVAFEQLFAASPAPKHLFNAAMARELAGHEGHAYLLLRRYLALPGLQSAELERAEDRLAALQRRTAAVRIDLQPADLSARGLQLTVERGPSSGANDVGRAPLVLAGDLLVLLAVADAPGSYDMFLEQGPWIVAARADGHEPARQELAVAGNQAQVALTLAASAPPETPVAFTLGPADLAGPVELTLTRDGGQPTHESVTRPTGAWMLAPGTYRLSLRAAGYAPLDRTFTVDAQPLTLDLVLRPEAATTPVPPARRPPPSAWVVGLGAGAGTSVVVGAVLLGVGGSGWSTTLDRYGQYAGDDAINWHTASSNLFRSWTLYGAGAGLLGSGVGLGLGAVGMHFAPRMKNPRHLWAAGAGIGAALAIAGGLLVGRAGLGLQATQWAHADRFAALDASVTDAYAGKNHHIGLSAALLGFGAGLGLASVLGLVRKPAPRKTTLVPTGTGLLVTGRF
ncbi:carboxypeptidase-like regulatory domain-containing protein [Nannocystis punicea]|uniref:Carboxypeptidase-like regulatory domain-containing protein n=1 Tax=Nannocystis punicea TaxID=2995304 RepID=A0ABY7H355_9BACT|nr:carboxypeptidase-like regulatory domain-containing protein [Nannocystis poenicansa]WAS93588.1 carboxypeptidase-like regulatory domain-containing protein [Nannocystis poenicansa]